MDKYWMTSENHECIDDEVTSYVVEVPVKDHKLQEVKEANQTELSNLQEYETSEEMEDSRQEKIRSCWVVTNKKKSMNVKSKNAWQD